MLASLSLERRRSCEERKDPYTLANDISYKQIIKAAPFYPLSFSKGHTAILSFAGSAIRFFKLCLALKLRLYHFFHTLPKLFSQQSNDLLSTPNTLLKPTPTMSVSMTNHPSLPKNLNLTPDTFLPPWP